MSAQDVDRIRWAIEGYFTDMDQNRCVDQVELAANDKERSETLAALDRLVALAAAKPSERNPDA